ncbi:Uso1 / p115 like vesicle tethering protein, head region [Musa troglodytarum]|uniref:Uso1 / p115 like vesicle tethering protein, head region n=1 Tax=Musa troglodytarum TaxID=320322 RepID=A0A9E7EXX3_9LILI|nr:Uso1 / p115 like vesicle tethering protein, head region [Musa troglodytarum]
MIASASCNRPLSVVSLWRPLRPLTCPHPDFDIIAVLVFSGRLRIVELCDPVLERRNRDQRQRRNRGGGEDERKGRDGEPRQRLPGHTPSPQTECGRPEAGGAAMMSSRPCFGMPTLASPPSTWLTTAFGLADGPAEDLYGIFVDRVRRERPPELREEIRGWDYSKPVYLDALKHLTDLKEEGETFCGRHTSSAENGRTLSAKRREANNVSLSLTHTETLILICTHNNFGRALRFLRCRYGTVMGDLLSEKFLNTNLSIPFIGPPLNTPSLQKYKRGVGGFVFGNENSASNEDSYVERYLDRISNGVLAEDRRAAMIELQSLVAESRAAQMSFGATGFPVLLNVLKEERDDVELIRGALETIVSALTPTETAHALKNEVQPALVNSDLLSRESESISLLLSLLSEDDFYVRYYTLQIITALLTHSPNRLQEAILSIPRGITRLMDMLMDREVIRNEALLLLTYLTREAEEIQKIVVFEGAFEKIFSIIREEGGSEGGVVVQTGHMKSLIDTFVFGYSAKAFEEARLLDCLELLNNLIRNNTSNQMLLKETIGFDPLVSILKLRRGSAYNFTQQKTINLLSALETIRLLLMGGSTSEPGKDANKLSNQTALAQKKILDHLLLLGVESQWAPVALRCLALRCIGDLVMKHSHNLDILGSKLVGEEPHLEPALNAIFRIILRTSTLQEFIAADYVFKCFCEENSDGQAMLTSTMTPQPSSNHATAEVGGSMSFGSMLLQALLSDGASGDLEMCSKATSVLSHILKDNVKCKERVLKVELEAPVPSLGSPEPLLHRIMKNLALAASGKDSNQTYQGDSYIQPLILRLLVTWLAECPNAVYCLLEAPAHLTYLLNLVSNPHASACMQGLAAVVLGECVLFNKSSENNRDAFSVADALSQKVGLTSFFLKFDELRKSLLDLPTLGQHRKRLSRSSTASMADAQEVDNDEANQKHEHPVIVESFDPMFIKFIERLETDIRESILGIFSNTKNKVTVLPAELEQRDKETDGDYIKRLKDFVETQCNEMQDLLGRNATLAEELVRTGGGTPSNPSQSAGSGKERVLTETLRQDLQEATRRIEILKSEKAKIESEANNYRTLATKLESDLKSLSDAYNSLEQSNFHLEAEVKALRKGGDAPYPDVEAIRAEAREEAEKESEAELNDLLVCLGQEQSKVEKLTSRLIELGEDVDSLLEGIGDDTALGEDDEDDDDDK